VQSFVGKPNALEKRIVSVIATRRRGGRNFSASVVGSVP